MKNVTVYTSTTCPYCTLVKDYLKEINVEYVEKNVQTDKEARMELIKKGYTGVPVVMIDSTEIVGFDKEKIDAALNA